MFDLNDHLRRDGARWREEADRQHVLDPDPLFDRITSDPVVAAPVHPLRNRFAGRAPLLLSVAAVTVAALAVGGVILTSGSHDAHHTSPALGATGTLPAVSISPSAPSSSATTRRPHISTSAHHAGGGAGPATLPAARQHTNTHTQPHTQPPGGSTSSATGPLACDSTDLATSVSSPALAGDHTTLTVSVVNDSTASCTISGFPAVQFAGDSTVSATPTTDTPPQLTLTGGATATAELDWDGTSATGTCTSYTTMTVTPPGGAAVQFPLDPPAQVCDVSTFVTHPLAAS